MTGANWLPNRRYDFGRGGVEVERDGDLTRLLVTGDLDLSTVARGRLAIERACERAPGKLVIDLSALEFVDSHGLQLLVATERILAAEGWDLALVPPAGHVRRVFTLAGLDWFFRDEPAAGAAATAGCD